ncbi:hypothetical protein SCLO_1008950 [Sphingobium cloacae]|uniref:PepSY-associated TM helix domain-containing protein n=2 Tax=Sphingobium cloacae TaxID=120107 RepID=A0A1E1F0A5_9SPHN|nr:hypothetical protein SCLO_1008950 [Sphingobium cloacae]
MNFITIMLRLHMDLFAGLPGELFLGGIGLLFLAAIVSGAVLYGPFTRKLEFGVVRSERSQRTRWLDLHNLLGVVTLAWAFVVGATGVMNELSTPLFAAWQQTDVKEMLAPWKGQTPPNPNELSSPQAAIKTALHQLPGMTATSIAFPGDDDGSPHHYLIWAHGASPLTERLFSPVLVDARTGKLTAVVRMPWYLRALEVSRPLHFGDYGGMPLKILWALLDLVTIVVLGSGLYLWIARPRRERAAKPPPRASWRNAGGGTRRMKPRRQATFAAQWGWPIGLAVLTLFGLISALIGEGGIWWWLSWAALAAPLLVIAHHLRRARQGRPHHARARSS